MWVCNTFCGRPGVPVVGDYQLCKLLIDLWEINCGTNSRVLATWMSDPSDCRNNEYMRVLYAKYCDLS